MQIKLWTGEKIETTPETFARDARAALEPWMQDGDRLKRYHEADGSIAFYVFTEEDERTDACAIVSAPKVGI